MPTIIDINAETVKLRTFHGRTPQTTFAERKGSAVQLAPYRDGMLLLNGTLTLDIVEQERVKSFELSAGMMVIVPPGAWHRVHSVDGVTSFSATIPGDHIDLDVDDPRPLATG